jgi:hypothetical protein
MQKSFPRLNFGRKKARMVRAHWRLMMELELLREISFWVLVVQLLILAYWIHFSWQKFRAKEASDAMRPLLSEDDWAVMRSGDTVLITLKLDHMTDDHQQRTMKNAIQIMKRARVRGVEVIALPLSKGDKVLVVSRSAQEKGSDGGQSTNHCASQRDPAGGQVAAQPKS